MIPNTIKVKDYLKVMDEYEANAAILPGNVVELMSTGKVRKHATASGNVAVMVAVEDELQGKGVEDAYAAGDRVQCWTPQRGDVVLMILADGQNVVIGDFLESDGAGRVQKHTVETVASADAQTVDTIYSKPIIGMSLEAQDLSTLDGSNSSLEANSQYILVKIV